MRDFRPVVLFHVEFPPKTLKKDVIILRIIKSIFQYKVIFRNCHYAIFSFTFVYRFVYIGGLMRSKDVEYTLSKMPYIFTKFTNEQNIPRTIAIICRSQTKVSYLVNKEDFKKYIF